MPFNWEHLTFSWIPLLWIPLLVPLDKTGQLQVWVCLVTVKTFIPATEPPDPRRVSEGVSEGVLKGSLKVSLKVSLKGF